MAPWSWFVGRRRSAGGRASGAPAGLGAADAFVGDAPHAWTMVNALRRRFGDAAPHVDRGYDGFIDDLVRLGADVSRVDV